MILAGKCQTGIQKTVIYVKYIYSIHPSPQSLLQKGGLHLPYGKPTSYCLSPINFYKVNIIYICIIHCIYLNVEKAQIQKKRFLGATVNPRRLLKVDNHIEKYEISNKQAHMCAEGCEGGHL